MAQALAAGRSAVLPCAQRAALAALPARPLAARRSVAARADPRVSPGRQYNENDDKMSSGASTSKDGSVFVDPAMPRAPKPKDNMSREMKSRLREEYVGLGGSANKQAAQQQQQQQQVGSRRMPRVLAASVETVATTAERTADDAPRPAAAPSGRADEVCSTSASSSASSSSSSASAAVAVTAAAKKGASKFVVDESEVLTSTAEHRFWTFGCIGLLTAATGVALSQVHTAGDAAVAGTAVLAAYLLSDLGTGVYHWGVDNYGDGDTPVFGRQIAAFQGHHQRPWTITQRQFCNNLHQVFRPAALPAAAILAASPFAPLWWNAWAAPFLFLVCMSQQFHAWSHMKKSELPGVVLALQESGLLISRKAHGAHHKAPFEGNYCIVSGVWNPLLDDSRFFRKLERFLFERTGAEPRCWHEPQDGWQELEQPAA